MSHGKKRILIVVASLTGGGAERVAVEWANALAGFGHDVAIMTDTSQRISYHPLEGVNVLSFNIPARPKGRGGRFVVWSLVSRIKLICNLLRVMRRVRTDVVIDVGHKYGMEVLVVSKVLGVNTIQTDHNACSRPQGMRMSRRDYFRKFLQSRWFDAFTELTERDRKVMEEHGATNVVSLCNPLTFRENEVCKNERSKTVLAVGRLDAWRTKGFDVLINAWKNIAQRHADWRLRIIGDGAPSTVIFLKKLCSEWHDRVDFVPYTDNIGEEYSRAEIFVLSSRCEGWGLVALEAMAHGCAAVVCDWEGRQGEYVQDGVNGLLCAPDCVNELENAIERVICDGELRERLQRNAPKSIGRFAPEKVGRNLEKIIYRVCDRS